MKLLVVNDDGIEDLGLWILASEMLALGEVRIYSPSRDYSGAGMSVSLTSEFQLRRATPPPGIDLDVPAYTVDATPATMAAIGALHGFTSGPDIVVSGINNGWNPGVQSYVSSGTVGGARVGVDLGHPGIAVSAPGTLRTRQSAKDSDDLANTQTRLSAIAAGVARFISAMATEKLMRQKVLVNINFPTDHSPASPVQLTTPSRFTLFENLRIADQFTHNCTSMVRLAYGDYFAGPVVPGDEIHALRAGNISVCVTEPFSGQVIQTDPWASVAQAIAAGSAGQTDCR